MDFRGQTNKLYNLNNGDFQKCIQILGFQEQRVNGVLRMNEMNPQSSSKNEISPPSHSKKEVNETSPSSNSFLQRDSSFVCEQKNVMKYFLKMFSLF